MSNHSHMILTRIALRSEYATTDDGSDCVLPFTDTSEYYDTNDLMAFAEDLKKITIGDLVRLNISRESTRILYKLIQALKDQNERINQSLELAQRS